MTCRGGHVVDTGMMPAVLGSPAPSLLPWAPAVFGLCGARVPVFLLPYSRAVGSSGPAVLRHPAHDHLVPSPARKEKPSHCKSLDQVRGQGSLPGGGTWNKPKTRPGDILSRRGSMCQGPGLWSTAALDTPDLPTHEGSPQLSACSCLLAETG